MRERDVHAGPVTACAWVDDGCFVTGCDDGMVAMWSTATGECAARMRGHEHAVTAALCADVPTQGRRVVTASRDGTVRVWKYEGDMGKTCQTLSGHTDHVTSLAFAPPTRVNSSASGATVGSWCGISPRPSLSSCTGFRARTRDPSTRWQCPRTARRSSPARRTRRCTCGRRRRRRRGRDPGRATRGEDFDHGSDERRTRRARGDAQASGPPL